MLSAAVIAFIPPLFILGSATTPVYDIHWYPDLPISHFSFESNHTFRMRYLLNDSYWKPGGPIFFYAGNEGDITLFADNTGFMWDLAPQFNALIVFAEHRFYGETLPFGSESDKDTSRLGYLSSEQALADYAVFLQWLKANLTDASNTPVITFGGSYGGMLAAWFRIKYPDITIGALAASAPIWQFIGLTPCWAFSATATQTFANSGQDCDQVIKKSWAVIKRLAANDDGRKLLNEVFGLCPNSTIKTVKDADALSAWLSGTWSYMAMADYPYSNSFLRPIPGWPVKVSCKQMTKPNVDDKTLMQQIVAGVSVFQNSTKSVSCFDTASVTTGALSDDLWDFQTCTEMVMPMCNNGTDMFELQPWNFTQFSDGCLNKYGLCPRPLWINTNYWGKDLRAASNIIFSNGLLDPWSSGGVLEQSDIISQDRELHVIIIPDGAHHYDLRGANPNDTPAVIKARRREAKIIGKWIRGKGSNITGKGSRFYMHLIIFGFLWFLKSP